MRDFLVCYLAAQTVVPALVGGRTSAVTCADLLYSCSGLSVWTQQFFKRYVTEDLQEHTAQCEEQETTVYALLFGMGGGSHACTN